MIEQIILISALNALYLLAGIGTLNLCRSSSKGNVKGIHSLGAVVLWWIVLILFAVLEGDKDD